jgi:hypothetical protein
VEAIDTKLLATLADPPEARMKSGEIERYYSLDAVGERLVGIGKDGELKTLAKKHGGSTGSRSTIPSTSPTSDATSRSPPLWPPTSR